MGKAIGIDLGTTNSCAAIIENGSPRLITYRGGAKTIPHRVDLPGLQQEATAPHRHDR